MANVNNPQGFIAIGHLTGGGFGAFRTAEIKSGYATTLAKGDAIKYAADGTIERLAPGDVNGAGVFMGCSYLETGTGFTTRRATFTGGTTVKSGDKIIANVLLDKDIEYVVQIDGAVGTDKINYNADLATVTDGDELGSNMQLTSGTNEAGIVDAAAQFRLIRPYDSPENEVDSAFNKWVVRFNENTDAQVDPTP